MKRSVNYKTKQFDAIVNYIVSLDRAHVTAAQIAGHFNSDGASIGRATIYRHLDKLTENGKLRKYNTDGVSGACYQYVENKDNCHIHLHLKCESCGALQHSECEEFNDVRRHVFDSHDFEVNALKTVLYGKCGECLKKDNRNDE